MEEKVISFHRCVGPGVKLDTSSRTCKAKPMSDKRNPAAAIFSSQPIPENYIFCVKLKDYQYNGCVRIGLTTKDPLRTHKSAGHPWSKLCCITSEKEDIYQPSCEYFDINLPEEDWYIPAQYIGISWSNNEMYYHNGHGKGACRTVPQLDALHVEEKHIDCLERSSDDRMDALTEPLWVMLNFLTPATASIIIPFPEGRQLNAAVAEGRIISAQTILYEGCSLYKTDGFGNTPWDYLKYQRNLSNLKLTKLLYVAGMDDRNVLMKLMLDTEQMFTPESLDASYVWNLLETATIINPVQTCSLLNALIDKHVCDSNGEHEFVSLVLKFREEDCHLSLKVLCAHVIWITIVRKNIGLSVYPAIKSLNPNIPNTLVNYLLRIEKPSL